jgi:hypothetical protein
MCICCRFMLNGSANKWVIKAPYVTNRHKYHQYVNSLDSAQSHLLNITNDMFSPTAEYYSVPYVIMQEKVIQNVEVKVVFLNKKYSHIAMTSTGSTRKSHGPFTTETVVKFAERALHQLSCAMPGIAILDGLVRVDIFKSNQGQLVVNEFESLDAEYASTDLNAELATTSFLQNYWEMKLLTILCDQYMDVVY